MFCVVNLFLRQIQDEKHYRDHLLQNCAFENKESLQRKVKKICLLNPARLLFLLLLLTQLLRMVCAFILIAVTQLLLQS